MVSLNGKCIHCQITKYRSSSGYETPLQVTSQICLCAKIQNLVEFSHDRTHSKEFLDVGYSEFWPHRTTEYSEFVDAAMYLLLLFSNMYFCRTYFSEMNFVKAKYGSRLQINSDTRACLRSIKHRNDLLHWHI
jgi:hypothetical protein